MPPQSGTVATTFDLAYFKSQEAAGGPLPLKGTVLISVHDKDKPVVLEVARRFAELGFRIKATTGTYGFLRREGVPCEHTFKILEHLRAAVVRNGSANTSSGDMGRGINGERRPLSLGRVNSGRLARSGLKRAPSHVTMFVTRTTC